MLGLSLVLVIGGFLGFVDGLLGLLGLIGLYWHVF